MGLDAETLEMVLDSLRDFAEHKLPDSALLKFDEDDEMPLQIVQEMCGPELGVQLLFLPEVYGGMGGGAFDVYRFCEAMARIDIGVATGLLATFLGSDPIVVGGTEEQKQKWLGRVAEEGALVAYGATEPQAGSDLAMLKTTAVPLAEEDGKPTRYKLNGRKQWISNGGVASIYTILANAPGGPTWFVLDRDTPGFAHEKPEEKHGIRASNTAALTLDDVEVSAEQLIGGVEGQGLAQAQAVFGYTRLMVAAFGLGGGWAALDRAIPYSQDRIQAGTPLSEKEGYTHKLIVPHVIDLEASRAFIEETAMLLDDSEEKLITEGAIAKYLATEAGNRAADASIQAMGGYGYTHEYMVEKIKRDVRITTIYEGTSEIMEMTIGRDFWQRHLKSRGSYFLDSAARLDELHARQPDVGAGIAALAQRVLAAVMERGRVARLTRHQHFLFSVGEWAAQAEAAGSMARRATRALHGELPDKSDKRFDGPALAAIARVYARNCAVHFMEQGLRWLQQDGDPVGLDGLQVEAVYQAQTGRLADLDQVADAVYGRSR
jgi:alkylation response protein AidB-like acyl-CoA dehydrogenase